MSALPRRSVVTASCAISLLLLGTAGCRDRADTTEQEAPGTAEGQSEGEPGQLTMVVRPVDDPVGTPEVGSDGKLESTSMSHLRIKAVESRLERHVRAWGLADPEHTWALIHALLVLPPDTKLPGSELTILDAILSMATTVEVAGRVVPTFSGEARDGTPREPHRNQVVKILLGFGVSLDHEFEADGVTFTVNDLVESALWRFEPPHHDAWEHESWTLAALARAMKSSKPTSFTNYQGIRFEGRELALRAAAHLNREMEFIEEARETGRPLQKRREGVHAHPCGGLHLARTPAIWMADPEIEDALIPAMRRAADTLAWRVGAEREVYDLLRAQHPTQEILLSAQEMKFYGHWLESMAELRDAGIDVDIEAVDLGVTLLVRAVERLDRIGTFDRMEDVRARRAQTYRDLIGDSAHALRGLRLWVAADD